MKKRRNTLGKRKRKWKGKQVRAATVSVKQLKVKVMLKVKKMKKVKVGAKTQKRGNDGNADDSLVAEEKDNPLEVPTDELEAQFNACVMRHRMGKIKKREERHGH